MITYEVGNLLESDAQALVNTVNTEGVMGKGIALQFKEEFPINYDIYRKACKTRNFNIGEVLITQDINRRGEKKYIVNFPTKTTWRKPSEYSYIGLGLHALKKKIEDLHIMSIAIPPLGSTCTEEKDRGFAYYVDCYTAIGIKQWRSGLAEGEADDSDGVGRYGLRYQTV